MAFRTQFALAFLPFKPGLLDGIRARPAIHVGQIKQFTKTTAFRTPALCRIVAEYFWIERLKGTSALRARALGRVNREFTRIIQRKEGTTTELERFIDELLWHFAVDGRALFVEHSNDNFDIVLTKAIEPKVLEHIINLSIGANFL